MAKMPANPQWGADALAAAFPEAQAVPPPGVAEAGTCPDDPDLSWVRRRGIGDS